MKKVLIIWVTDTSEVERYLLSVNAVGWNLLVGCNHESLSYSEGQAGEDVSILERLLHHGEWGEFRQSEDEFDLPYPALDGIFVVME